MTAAPEDICVGVGHIERFNPIVGEIKKIMDTPLYVEMKRHNPASSRVKGSSVVEDLMIHDIDILQNILFEKVPCTLHVAGNPDVCSVLLQCGKVPVSLSASRKSSKKIRLIYIEQEEFTIEGDFMTQEVTIYRKPGQYHVEDERYVQENIIEKVMVNKLEPLKLELGTFIDCAKSGRPFPITPLQAIRNLEMCELIRAGFPS
jgi:predicted dehydrogenase